MESSEISIDNQWANDAGGKFKNVVGEAIDELIGTMAPRSAALDIAGLCEYEASDAWTIIIIRKLREPLYLGMRGFLWNSATVLTKSCGSGFRTNAGPALRVAVTEFYRSRPQ